MTRVQLLDILRDLQLGPQPGAFERAVDALLDSIGDDEIRAAVDKIENTSA